MELPIIIVEFGQQRQRLKLNAFSLTTNELCKLVSKAFEISFNWNKYEILLCDKRVDLMTKLDLTQFDQYPRFKIQLNSKQSRILSDSCCSATNDGDNELTSLKRRLKKASTEIMNVTLLINSISRNYQNLIQALMDEETYSSNKYSVHSTSQVLTVPPGFKPLLHQESRIDSKQSAQDSQSTDEGIDRDAGSVSVFESAHSEYELESIYLECREDLTLINEPNLTSNNNNNHKPQWRNQSYRSRPYWNSNKAQYPSNGNRDEFGDRPRLKKPVSLNKAPLPLEKKKNIPCKYAAGGTCKRGSQCRFIHVV